MQRSCGAFPFWEEEAVDEARIMELAVTIQEAVEDWFDSKKTS